MRAFLWRYKFSLLVQIVILVIAWLSNGQTQEQHQKVLQHLGKSWEILSGGRLWHLLTGTWIQSAPGLTWNMASMCLMVGLGTFPLERAIGSRTTAITVILGDWFSTMATAITLKLLVMNGNDSLQSLLTPADSGTSALAWSGMAAGAVLISNRFRVHLVFLVLAGCVFQFIVETPGPGIAHMWAVAFGLVVGTIILNRRKSEGGDRLWAIPS